MYGYSLLLMKDLGLRTQKMTFASKSLFLYLRRIWREVRGMQQMCCLSFAKIWHLHVNIFINCIFQRISLWFAFAVLEKDFILESFGVPPFSFCLRYLGHRYIVIQKCEIFNLSQIKVLTSGKIFVTECQRNECLNLQRKFG